MENLNDTITRIQKMEQYFDEILEKRKDNPNIIFEDEDIRKKYDELLMYCENGQWLRDYECDERGELPADLKRGVLSQDALYDLICDEESNSYRDSLM